MFFIIVMSDFKYIGCQSINNKRHFVSQHAFVFKYSGSNASSPDDIRNELGSLFSSQSFAPFQLSSKDYRYSIYIFTKCKNIVIPVAISEHPQSPNKNELWYIGVDVGCLGSKFESERLNLEKVLEEACKGVAGKV